MAEWQVIEGRMRDATRRYASRLELGQLLLAHSFRNVIEKAMTDY
jgi:hypothetical protein